MMNMAIKLKATKREDLSNSKTKQLRESGQVPAVVYGKNNEPKTVAVDSIELLKTVRDEGRNAIISLEIEGDAEDVMMHEYQMDVIKDKLLHVDFYVFDKTEKMEVSIPVRLEGESVGVKEGGVLQQPEYEVLINVKPADIPDEIVVDVSTLDIGDVVAIENLNVYDKYEFVDESETVIVTIVPPTEEEEETEVDPDAEPELIGAKDDDEEEEEN